MSNELLDKFFRENTVDSETSTAPAFAHFCITIENNSEVNDKFHDTLNNLIFEYQPERKEMSSTERNEIESATTCEQIIRFIRRYTDPANQHILVNKALQFEDEIVPALVRMLKTSLNDNFIETTIRILAKCKLEITEEIIGYFDDMRNPYGQAMTMVLLGFKAKETYIPWFIERYNKFKNDYPNESYCEGAYYALFEIDRRFYSTPQS